VTIQDKRESHLRRQEKDDIVSGESATSSSWVPVGILAQQGTESNKPPSAGDFEGKALTLCFENGQRVEYAFKTAHSLSWRKTSRGKGKPWTKEAYSAIRVRGGIYFLDYLEHLERATSVSIVLDLDGGIFKAVIGRLPSREESKQSLLDRAIATRDLTGVRASFLNGSIGEPFGEETPRYLETKELLGRRVEYAYSPTDLYEHLYLNECYYTWHCLTGAERGLADTDRCHYFKIADRLYLFVWREKVIPTLGVLVEDFDRMRTSGKLLGYRNNDFGRLSNFTIGARARILE
jgi:hypothetical protein